MRLSSAMLDAIVWRLNKTTISDRAKLSRVVQHISSEASITSAVRVPRMSRVVGFGIARPADLDAQGVKRLGINLSIDVNDE